MSLFVITLLWALAPAWAADEGASAEAEASEEASEETAAVPKRPNLKIDAGTRVTIEYVATLEDGTVIDDNDGDLMVFDHGDSPLHQRVEDGLVGLVRGESKRITLEVEDAFGPIDPKLNRSVDAEDIPEYARVVGAEIEWTPERGGRSQMVKVLEVEDGEILIDFNHPYAGERIHFDVKVIAVRAVRE
jgi:FKBP-type peptidyl-prolyl cis-trans isomerase 2